MCCTVCTSNNDDAIVIHVYFWFFSFSRLSTKPGSVPSILKSHSFTAATEFLASNTVWRFRQGVHLYYQTMMMSSMEDYQVSSVQVQCRLARLTSSHSKLNLEEEFSYFFQIVLTKRAWRHSSSNNCSKGLIVKSILPMLRFH